MKTAISDMLMEKTVKPISWAPCSAAANGSMPASRWREMFFHHDDGVVDDKAGGDGERHQRKIVEAEAEQVHHGEGADQRNGNGDAGNERGARRCAER